MRTKIKELREKRTALITEARKIVEGAEDEGRDLNDEEKKKYDTIFNDASEMGQRAERMQRQMEVEAELAQSVREPNKPEPSASPEPGKEGTESPRNTKEYCSAFLSYMRRGLGSLNGDESRALQADSDTTGGFVVAPQEFVNKLIQAVDDMLFIRQAATVIPLGKAESLGVPSLDTDPADADWTSEIATGNEDSSMAFGKRELHPHPLGKLLRVSNKLLASSVIDVEALVRERLAYKFALPQEKAFMTGTGAGQPLGLFTASADGISTTRDVSAGNTTTSPKFDGLIAAKYSLKAQYWPKAAWMFHRDALKLIAQLKDGNSQYIWQLSQQLGQPDRLLGWPVSMSENVPNTFTTAKYVGIVGDYSNYWIADALDFSLQRLVELYAATNQVGFIGRMETDGMPVLEEAFARVKLA